MKLTLKSTQFQHDTGAVAMLMEHTMGSFYLNSTEAALEARITDPDQTLWGNAEALAEAQHLTSSAEIFTATTGMPADKFPEEGFTVVMAVKPAVAPLVLVANDAP